MRALAVLLLATSACSAATGELEPDPPGSPVEEFADLGFGAVIAGTRASAPFPEPLAFGVPAEGLTRCEPGSRFCWTRDPGLRLIGVYSAPAEAEAEAAIDRETVQVRPCDDCAPVTLHADARTVRHGLDCVPHELDAGALEPGACGTVRLDCRNEANTTLSMLAFETSGSALSFDRTTPRELTPGERASLHLRFCPGGAGPARATAAISVRHGEGPVERIEHTVMAEGLGPVLQVSPDRLDFGEVAAGAPSRRMLETGGGGVIVDRITTSAAWLEVTPGPSAGRWWVTVIGGAEGVLTGELELFTNDVRNPRRTIPVEANVISLPPCTYVLRPDRLDLGLVTLGRESGGAIEIANTGSSDCLLGPATVLEPGSPFEPREERTRSQRIAPGSSQTIALAYRSPRSSDDRASLELEITPSPEPRPVIELEAREAPHGLEVGPSRLFFEALPPFCGLTDGLELRSRGAVEITSVTISEPADAPFTLTGNVPAPERPVMLGPGESLTLRAGFRSAIAGSYARQLEIVTAANGRPERHTVSLEGSVVAGPEQTDVFEQLRNQLDLLLIADDSCSMRDDRALEAGALEALLATLDAEGFDYRIAVTGTTIVPGAPGLRSRSNGERWATRASEPSPLAALLELVPESGGGGGVERGLDAAERALAFEPRIGGFFRPFSPAVLLFVSDEDDRSPGASIPSLQRIDQRVSRPGPPWVLAVVTGPEDGGCRSARAIAGPAPRYHALAEARGGVASICDDWSALFARQTPWFAYQSRFALSRSPVLTTLVITVDGQDVPAVSAGIEQWRYDVETNAIVFSPGRQPPPGARIRIEYQAGCG